MSNTSRARNQHGNPIAAVAIIVAMFAVGGIVSLLPVAKRLPVADVAPAPRVLISSERMLWSEMQRPIAALPSSPDQQERRDQQELTVTTAISSPVQADRAVPPVGSSELLLDMFYEHGATVPFLTAPPTLSSTQTVVMLADTTPVVVDAQSTEVRAPAPVPAAFNRTGSAILTAFRKTGSGIRTAFDSIPR